jgi:cytochrome c peroxidase
MKIKPNNVRWAVAVATLGLMTGCSDSGDGSQSENDIVLAQLIEAQSLTGDPSTGRDLPEITDEVAQLGMKLFYSKSLGGGFDSACVTCHHPVLGGGDNLSLPVGVDAEEVDLLGPGRIHDVDGAPNVPRNAPTVFNLGMWDSSLFHDSRVQTLSSVEGTNGAGADISTPDSGLNTADANAGANLSEAQARFPVTSAEEMRTEAFENGNGNTAVRDHLAGRLGNYGAGTGELATNDWLTEFQTAFGSTADAETLITYDNIATALAEYERSMVFVDSPWSNYVAGDSDALTDQQKEGAILFFTASDEGGAGCSSCHSGDFFTDEGHHTVAFPLIGNGKGDTNDDNSNDDFGRGRVTGEEDDRYRFRTPSLLNIEVTAPYGHVGSYQTLEDVVRHYTNPRQQVTDYFDNGGWCQLDQFEDMAGCAALYPDAETNSVLALDKLDTDRSAGESEFPTNLDLTDEQVAQLVAFLEALTDPCVEDRSCLAPWIPDTSDTGPDGNQLNAVDEDNELL